MEFVKKETIYTFTFNEKERISIIGILALLNRYGKISGIDDESKETIRKLLNDMSCCDPR